MPSRTEKILQLAKTVNIIQKNQEGKSDSALSLENETTRHNRPIGNLIKTGTYLVDETGDLLEISETDLIDSNSGNAFSESFTNIPENLNVSEAELLAIENLENLNCSEIREGDLDNRVNQETNFLEEATTSENYSVSKISGEMHHDIAGETVPENGAEFGEGPEGLILEVGSPEINKSTSLVNENTNVSEEALAPENYNVSKPCEVMHHDITSETVPGININVAEPEEHISPEDLVIEGRSEEMNNTGLVNENTQKRKRKKRHQVTENEWECKKAKILREQGKEYKGRKVIGGKVTGFVNRPERKMGAINCKCNGKTYHCKSLEETERHKIFDEFWKLSWGERKIFVKTMTDISLTQRSRDRKTENSSRRKFSFKFFLNVNRSKVRVCKKTLMATLGIGEWMVNHWLKDSEDQRDEIMEEDVEVLGLEEVTENRRLSKKVSRQEELSKRLATLKEFLLSLPNVESHYCRASSQKLYLESNWTSKSQLYQFYCENWCKQKGCTPLSSCTFYKTFEDLNLSLYRPKKDQCDVCRAFKMEHISEELYNEHIQKKEDARQEKENNKKNEEHVYTVDLQSLLLCPKSDTSALYYKRKLSVHNICIYDLKTHDGYCYLWNESEGQLTANEFSSILSSFIESQLPLRNNSKKILFFSDGCNYQNRSAILSNALLHLAVKHNITIESKYLEKGHTQMECDSMHATIERYMKHRDIHVPADYVDICKNARKNPRPYKVTYLEHYFFKNYTKPIMYKSIRPGYKKGDPTVVDIRSLRYSDDGNIHYKLNFKEEYKLLPACEERFKQTEDATRKSKRKSNVQKPESRNSSDKTEEIRKAKFLRLYDNRLSIDEEKYKHLQDLKMSIPQDYHSFYDNLLFSSLKK